MDDLLGLIMLAIFGGLALMVWWARRRRFQRSLASGGPTSPSRCLLCGQPSQMSTYGCPSCGHEIDTDDPSTKAHRECLRDLDRALDTLISARDLSSGRSTNGDWIDTIADVGARLFTPRRRSTFGFSRHGGGINEHQQMEGHEELMRGLRQVAELVDDYPELSALPLSDNPGHSVAAHLEGLFDVDEDRGSLLKDAVMGRTTATATAQAADAGDAIERLVSVRQTIAADLTR